MRHTRSDRRVFEGRHCLSSLILLFVAAGAIQLDAQEYQFEQPIRLKAAGEVIDTGKQIAHSGPAFADINSDGLVDLLVGNFRGTIEYFENTGTSQAPEYAAGKMLKAGGKWIKINNW